MKLLIHLMLPVSLLVLASCGAQKNTTTLKVTSGMALSNSSFPGGLVFYGRSTSGQTFSAPVSFTAAGGSNQVEIILDKGTWSFSAVGWSSGDLMEGASECAHIPSVNIDADDKTINLDLNASDCSLPAFGGNITATTGLFKPLRLVTCGTFYTNSTTKTLLSTNDENFCTSNINLAPDFKIHAKSAKIRIPVIIPGQAVSASSPLSVCVSLLNGKLATNKTLPALNLPLSIELFETDCSDPEEKLLSSYVLNEGINFNYTSFDKQYYPGAAQGDPSTLYLLASISRRGTSSLMASMPSFKCDSSNPSRPCIKFPTSSANRLFKLHRSFYLRDAVGNDSCADLNPSTVQLIDSSSAITNSAFNANMQCREDNGKIFISLTYSDVMTCPAAPCTQLKVTFPSGIYTYTINEETPGSNSLAAYDLIFKTLGHEDLISSPFAVNTPGDNAYKSLWLFFDHGDDNESHFGALSDVRSMFSPDAIGGIFAGLTVAQMDDATSNLTFWDEGELRSYQIKSVADATPVPAFITDNNSPSALTSTRNFTKKVTISRILGGALRLEQIIRYIDGEKVGMQEEFHKDTRDNNPNIQRIERTLTYWNTQGTDFDRFEKYEIETEVENTNMPVRTRSTFTRAERDGVGSSGPTGSNARVEEYNYESFRDEVSGLYFGNGDRSYVFLNDDKADYRRQNFQVSEMTSPNDFFTNGLNLPFLKGSGVDKDSTTVKSPNGLYTLTAWSYFSSPLYNMKVVIKQAGAPKSTYSFLVAANSAFLPKAIIDNDGKALVGFVKFDGTNHRLFALTQSVPGVWKDFLGNTPSSFDNTNAIDSDSSTAPQFALVDKGAGNKTLVHVNSIGDLDGITHNGTSWLASISIDNIPGAHHLKITPHGGTYYISYLSENTGRHVGLIETSDLTSITKTHLGTKQDSTAGDAYVIPNGGAVDVIVADINGGLKKFSNISSVGQLSSATADSMGFNYFKAPGESYCFSRSTTTAGSLDQAPITGCQVPDTSYADAIKPQFKFDIDSLKPANMSNIFTIPNY